jgi:hypothetical protein
MFAGRHTAVERALSAERVSSCRACRMKPQCVFHARIRLNIPVQLKSLVDNLSPSGVLRPKFVR